MTVAGKVNLFVISVAVIAGTLLGASALRSEYLNARETLLERTYFRIRGKPQLQMAIYRNEAGHQENILNELIQASEALQFARLLDSSGKLLNEVSKLTLQDIPGTALDDLRQGMLATDNSLTTNHRLPAPDGYSPIAMVTGGELFWDLTAPVLTAANPDDTLSPETFGLATLSAPDTGSQHLMGHVHIGISRSVLLQTLMPKFLFIALQTVALITLCSLLSFFVTRRITAPFNTVVRMAEDIAGGRKVSTKGLEKNAEFRDLVGLLNGIIGDFKHRATKMEVDQQLLSMKVAERTSQLSKRNKELNKAVREVTETRDHMRRLAYYDSLTALPNRRLFTEQLDLLLRLARREKETLGLLFLDLDNFKRINDSLGHSAGDILLREIAKRLARCIRDSDVIGHNVEPNSSIGVSRLGGDEFTVVLNKLASAESAHVVAQRILEAIGSPIQIEGHELVVTPSIGIAIAPDDADTVEGLQKAADTAMYHAKSMGKNKILQYGAKMDAAGVERLQLENDLRKAMARNELTLHYQPQVDTLTGKVVGAEALMRWDHPEQGPISPFKFIPLAEEIGLISSLGEWALERACSQLIELQAQGIDLPKVSVNVSALQFTPSFVDRVAEILARSGLRPNRLELELTEGIMIDGAEETITAVRALKELGVLLSIDDFGTGYSSLSYLSRFPLDELKIDRSFVVGMENSDNDASLVVAIIAMAKSMKLSLVAEGVENPDQYRFLKRYGASMIQGYMFSKPVPLDELKPLLEPGYFKKQIEAFDPPVPEPA